jgi:hypothetical protein
MNEHTYSSQDEAAAGIDDAMLAYSNLRKLHWNGVAGRGVGRWSRYYHRRLEAIYRFLIPRNSTVLELGCGRGDLLASVSPRRGIGIDFSSEMIRQARITHPDMEFIDADVHSFSIKDVHYDAIIVSDLINDIWDVQTVFERINEHSISGTRVILNFYSHVWSWALKVGQKLGVTTPTLEQNWLTVPDVANLMSLSGMEIVRSWQEVLWPFATPLLANIANRFFVKIFPFNFLALTNFVVARRSAVSKRHEDERPSVSVIVPARNEAGNIAQIFKRVPTLGRSTELIFVEGHSCDNTYTVIEREIATWPERNAKVLRQKGIGKADAVRAGFAEATGDIVIILDADMTVAPEDLTRFCEVLVKGKAEFANGVRLVYPMEDKAMRFLNLLGNKFFTWAFSWVLGQSIKDTLCGTKALWKRDYDRIFANRAYFGDFDPFGDYELIFGATKLSLRIVDVPIRYRSRTYGATQIHRWHHGWLLLRMTAFAARRLKFV